MPNQKKINQVARLTDKLSQAKTLVLTDYTGLNVAKISELRQQLKLNGGEYEVVKNSLLSLAANEQKMTLDSASFAHPTAIVWTQTDELTPLKILSQFIKQNELPIIKSGYFQGQAISADQVKYLANLPPLEALRGQLVGLLNQPLTGLVRALNWNIAKLVFVLQSISKSKGGENTN